MSEEITTQKSLAVTPEYIQTYKFDKWSEYYTDINNPKTYSNAIQSVFAAYGANLSYSSAGHIAVENKKKFKYMRSMIAEKNGITFDKFMKMAWLKYSKSDRPEWFDKVANITGFNEFLDDPKSMGQGVSVKTENKDGTVSEIKIVSFTKPNEPDQTN